MTAQAKSPTVKTVVAHAEKLREAADRMVQRDPFASPWWPTTASARRQYDRELSLLRADRGIDHDMEPVDETELEAEAARRAILWMDQRTARDFIEYREQENEARRSRQRHQKRSKQAARDREAQRGQLSPGQRIDQALAALSVIGNVQAAALDADVVSGSRGQADPRFPGDPAGRAKHEVVKCIRFVEAEVEEARRRRVELERDAS